MFKEIKEIRETKEKQTPLIIYGAGIVGQTMLSICQQEGVEIECFLDGSEKVAGTKIDGLEVVGPWDLKSKYPNALFLISVAAIKDVIDKLQELGYPNWIAGGTLLKGLDTSQPDPYLNHDRFAVENCILCHEGFINPTKLFIRSVDLIITERCSLKCKDCSNLMQYYEKPQNCDTEMLLRSIDTFCAVVDDIMDFRVIGGDAFMNKEWPAVVNRLTSEPKVRRVVLYTNGTIVPKEKDIETLKNEKVLIIITDYGTLSRKLVNLRHLLENSGISYHILKIVEWLDCSAISPHRRTQEELKELFKICCAKNMATLSDGKLFRCPYSANATRLKAVPNYEGDHIDLFKEPLDETTKSRVKDYILNKEYLDTCDFCDSRPLSGNEVQPAIQIKKPLPYRKFNK